MISPDIEREIAKLKGPIAVFGAGGFVGANLFRRLIKSRNDVYAVTYQSNPSWRLLDCDAEKIVHCNVNNAEESQSLLDRHRFQTIFYLAAYGAYSEQNDVHKIYETNILGLVHVLQAASQLGVTAFVHAGSSSEYGSNSSGPTETASLIPNSHYAVSKVSAAYLLQYYNSHHRVPTINLRYYSMYGPWEEATRLIPTLIRSGLNGGLPPFVDPEVSRDFIYIDDAVEATLLAATEGVRKAPGQSLNIATGHSTSMREVAAEAKTIFGITDAPIWSSMPNRSWDHRKDWFGDPHKAKEILSWQARTTFHDGLERTIAWTRSNPNVAVSASTVASARFTKRSRLSAIIACYRDAQAIPVMHERLTRVFQQLDVDYEIIFVNDASPDNTRDVCEDICSGDSHVLMIEHSRNFGSQSAFLSGMGVATGDAVILLDGDLQDPPEIIPDFYGKWRENFEVVYGRRVKREMSHFMHFFYKSFYRLFKYLAYVPVPPDAGDFSLIDRKVVDELLMLPETDQFLRGLRAWVGFRQTAVDYVRPARPFGTSTNNWHRNILWARKGIFSFSFVPLDLLFYGGIGFTLLSVIAVLIQIVYRLFHPGLPRGVATIIVLVLFFGGLQLIALSVLGEYLGKVLEETKKRPKFIRRAIRIGDRYHTGMTDIRAFIKTRKDRMS